MSSSVRVFQPFRARIAVPLAGSGPARSPPPALQGRPPASERGPAAAGRPSNRHTSIPPRQYARTAKRVHPQGTGGGGVRPASGAAYRPGEDVQQAKAREPAQPPARPRRRSTHTPRSPPLASYLRPGPGPPGGDRRLIPLRRPVYRDLRAEPHPVQQVRRAPQRVPKVEQPRDQRRDPGQRPPLVLVPAVGRRA
jgi:hypothetical protein